MLGFGIANMGIVFALRFWFGFGLKMNLAWSVFVSGYGRGFRGCRFVGWLPLLSAFLCSGMRKGRPSFSWTDSLLCGGCLLSAQRFLAGLTPESTAAHTMPARLLSGMISKARHARFSPCCSNPLSQ